MWREARIDPLHCDAVFDRTDECAEVTAHALVFIDEGNALGRSSVRNFPDHGGRSDAVILVAGLHMDALVCAVPTCCVTKLAADAFGFVYASDDPVVQIQVFPLGDLGKAEAAEIFDISEAFLIHPAGEAVDPVFHDAEAIVHGRGAGLYGLRSQ